MKISKSFTSIIIIFFFCFIALLPSKMQSTPIKLKKMLLYFLLSLVEATHEVNPSNHIFFLAHVACL